MNKVERVLNAMNNRPVDRPPVGFWHHFEGADMAENFVNAQVQYYRDSQTDFIKVMSDGIPYTPVSYTHLSSPWSGRSPAAPRRAVPSGSGPDVWQSVSRAWSRALFGVKFWPGQEEGAPIRGEHKGIGV